MHSLDRRPCSPLQPSTNLVDVHHQPCHLEYVSVLSFGYSVLLRCLSASEPPPDSFLYEGFGEVLFPAIRSKASDVPTGCLFNFVFEFLEVGKHFALLPHKEYLGVLGEVIDERHIIPVS